MVSKPLAYVGKYKSLPYFVGRETPNFAIIGQVTA